jgi:hypothetical protein
MENNKNQFPSEEVTLPSKGVLYPEGSSLKNGIIEMKYMTAREEDILTNQNYIQNGTVLDRLLKSLIVSDIDYNELLIGDKDAIMVAARILGYGSEYTIKHNNESINIDLSKLEDRNLDTDPIEEGKNEFEFTLPTSKINLTFKLLTHGDEKAIDQELKGLKKIDKTAVRDLSTRLKYMILSVNGNYEKKEIRDFVDNRFLARDAREFRNYYKKIQPSIDLSYDYEDEMGNITKIDVPVGINFFWPDASL